MVSSRPCSRLALLSSRDPRAHHPAFRRRCRFHSQREGCRNDRAKADTRPAQGSRRGAWHEHDGRPYPGLSRRDAGDARRLRRRRRDAGQPARRKVSPRRLQLPRTERESVQRLVREDGDSGRIRRTSGRPDGRHQGQRLRRVHTDDEWCIHAGGLYTRRGRNDCHAATRRRCDHCRQGALRVLLSFRRQPHGRPRPCGEPAQAGSFGRRVLVGLGRARRRGPG